MKNTGKKRARFWVLVQNGWAKVTLEEGKSLEFQTGGPHDEGYSYVGHRYEWERGTKVIRYSWDGQSRDCDGPQYWGGAVVCPVSRLRVIPEETANLGSDLCPWKVWYPARPDWQEEKQSKYYRDVFAESAGY